MKKYILIIAVVLASALNYQLTEAQEKSNKLLIMGVPQYLAIEGLRIDFDFKTDEKKWISVSPLLFLQGSEEESLDLDLYGYYNDQREMLYGGGIEITFKRFLSKNDNATGLYLGYGPNFKFVNIDAKTNVWSEGDFNGNEIYLQAYKPNTTYISKVGANCIIGYQGEISHNVFADVFLGFGMRYSFISFKEGESYRYNSSWIDYGYSGTLLVTGFRLGVGL